MFSVEKKQTIEERHYIEFKKDFYTTIEDNDDFETFNVNIQPLLIQK